MIRGLAADRVVETPPGRTLSLALAGACATGAVVFFSLLGVRADILAALGTLRFDLKFVLTLAVAAAALRFVLASAYPGSDAGTAARGLLVPIALMVAAVVWELFAIPQGGWWPRLVGSNAMLCLAAIPVIALAPLIVILVALRRAAPTAPMRAGAAAGVLAAGIAATFYAAHCIDDSPLFVATWYTLATAIVTVAGAAIGARLLRW